MGKCFNPRTHTGCDAETPSGMLNAVGFQSTHPHGVRRRTIPCSGYPSMFQSTHPHGVRLFTIFALFCNAKFQSTHPHGVRRRRFRYHDQYRLVSIHAPTRGATFFPVKITFPISKFQSTHPHGVRRYSARHD